MPTGRPDYWYGTALYFSDTPGDGEVTRGPTCNWAYDHENNADAHHAEFDAADAVTAMGGKADDNALHHDRYDPGDEENVPIGYNLGVAGYRRVRFYSLGNTTLVSQLSCANSLAGDLEIVHYGTGDLNFYCNSAWRFTILAAGGVEHIWDDTPTEEEVHKGVTSDWAYKHQADVDAHHAKYLDADAVTAMGAKADDNPLHHDQTPPGVTDHGALNGLADDDHTQYVHTANIRNMTTYLKWAAEGTMLRLYDGGTYMYAISWSSAGPYPFSIWQQAGSMEIFRIDNAGNLQIAGMVDGVDLAGHAADDNAHHTPPAVFADRGDPASADWTQAVLTMNGFWHDMNLSTVVPEGAIAVLLRGAIRDNISGNILGFREHGNSNAMNASFIETQVADRAVYGDMMVKCDASRHIDYYVKVAAADWIEITVGGWWI